MFSVYVEDKNGLNKTCIFHDESIDLALKLISPQLELEDNSAGSFQFTMYPSNQGYGLIPDTTTDHVSILSSTVRIYREWTTPSETAGNPPYWHKEEIWEGRPLTEDKDFYNARVVYCEGAFSYLNDICQPVKEYKRDDGGDVELIDYVNGVLSEYNKHAASNRQFDTTKTYVNPVGISSLCTLKDSVASVDLLPTGPDTKDYDVRQIGDTSSKIYYMYTTLTGWKDASKSIYHTMGSFYKTGGETTKDAIGGLVSTFGGHIKVVTITDEYGVDHRCLYYTANANPEDAYLYPEGSATAAQRGEQQEVTFGKNLLDLSKKRDGSTFFTVLLPVGAEIGSTPETIESMCPNMIRNGDLITSIYGGSDIWDDPTVAYFDSVSLTSIQARERNVDDPDDHYSIRRKVIVSDIPQEYNGYDFFLFTSSFLRAETDSTASSNTYFYRLSDISAQPSRIDDLANGMGYGGNAKPATYANHRIISMKKMSPQICQRQTLNGEKIQLPVQGIYSFMFSVGDDYAMISRPDGSNPEFMPDNNTDWKTQDKVLQYPKFYRAPYARENYIQSGLRKVDLVGQSGDTVLWYGTHPTDNHGRSASTTYPYNRYGADDVDIAYANYEPADRSRVAGEVFVTSNSKNAWWLNNFYPFCDIGVPDIWCKDEGGQRVYDDSLLFTTGYTGRHVCRISVEPGRTYYLSTRVTNKTFPQVKHTPGSQEDRDDPAFNADGSIRGGEAYNVFVYAVVVKRLRKDTNTMYYEVVSKPDNSPNYMLASASDITTDLFMEEIKIPDVVYPERFAPESESGWDSTVHMELWFACDQCYINGCANLDPDAGPVGYEPELYILDKDLAGSSNQDKNDYQDKVTVAPLQRPKAASNYDGKDPSGDNTEYPDNFGFPYEYVINREMYEKYGPIVKRSEYSNATTPEKLMEYVNLEMLSMTEDPSFEVSAADLKACGVADCDTFRLLQKIKIETVPHGVDQRVTLTKISMDLADLSSNQYTFGYEPTSDLSAMKNGGES